MRRNGSMRWLFSSAYCVMNELNSTGKWVIWNTKADGHGVFGDLVSSTVLG